jgi:hypothetical protein
MIALSVWAHAGAAAAAIAAGAVNAVAGGGTLISFPVLTALGVPAVRANATNTVSLCPGYVSGAYAQREDLRGLCDPLRVRMIAAGCGGLAGSVLLMVTSESVFRQIVPLLILTACALLAAQDRIRGSLQARRGAGESHHGLEVAAIGLVSTYGGYFGAGLGIMLMAVMGLFSELSFIRLNAVKQLLAFIISISAAGILSFSGEVVWTLVLVMAPGSVIGGHFGGTIVGLLPPTRLRLGVIVFGVVVALVYLLRW